MATRLAVWVGSDVRAVTVEPMGAVPTLLGDSERMPAIVGYPTTGSPVVGAAALELLPELTSTAIAWWSGDEREIGGHPVNAATITVQLVTEAVSRVMGPDVPAELVVVTAFPPPEGLESKLGATGATRVHVVSAALLVDASDEPTVIAVLTDRWLCASLRHGLEIVATSVVEVGEAPGSVADAARRATAEVAPTSSPALSVLVGDDQAIAASAGAGIAFMSIADVLTAAANADFDMTPVAAAVASPVDAVVDDDVQFTVFRPRTARVQVWEKLIVFAHKTETYEEDGRIIDPMAEINRIAPALIGPAIENYVSVAHDSSADLPRGTDLRFVPDVPGVEFSPPVQEIRWLRGLHHVNFDFRAPLALSGSTVRGTLSVYVGTVLIADVALALRFTPDMAAGPMEPSSARQYRKIFASYSHEDAAIVENVGKVIALLGDEFVRDVDRLRSGQIWNDELARFIRDADVFQLYWSRHSMTSPFVREEWQYAISLNRPGFVRPVFWEQPRPIDPEHGLPPPELDRIHFSYLTPQAWSTPTPVAHLPAAPQAPLQAPPQAVPAAWQSTGPPTPPPAAPAAAGGASGSPPRKGRARMAAIATAAAAVVAIPAVALTVGGSGGGSTVAEPTHRTSATLSTVATPPSSTFFYTLPHTTSEPVGSFEDAAKAVVQNYFADINAQDSDDAVTLICAAQVEEWQNAIHESGGDFTVIVDDYVFLESTPSGDNLALRYRVTTRPLDGGDASTHEVTFTMVDESGIKICGEA